MAKLVSCFECGYDYRPKSHKSCPRCGEVKLFDPQKHDPNYDMMDDPKALAKIRIRFSLFIFALLTLAFTVLLK
jgi:hypothetical protein